MRGVRDIVVPGGGGGTVTGGVSNINISAGTKSNNLTNVVFSNSNGVSFGLNGSTITATVKTDYQTSGAYLTTAMQSNAVTLSNIKVSAGTLSVNRSDITFSNSNGISFGLETNGVLTGTVATNYQSQGAYLTTAMQSNAVTLSNIKISAGTKSANRSDITFSDSNGISFGLDTNGVITGTVATNYQSQGAYLTTAMQSNAVTLSNIKLSGSGGSVLGSDFTFANSNGFTFGLDTAARQFTASYTVPNVPAQTNQTVGLYGIGNTTESSSTTLDARTLSINVHGSLTVGFSNGSIELSAPNAITTADLSQNSSKYVQNWKLTANTAGTTSSAQGTDLWLAGGQGITLSGNSNTITFSVGSYITTADLSQNSSKYVQNWKLTGNTAGTTSSAQGTDLWFSGGNNITVSGNSNTIVISAGAGAQSNQTLGLYAVSNTEGASSSSTFDARTISFQGKGQVSVGFSNGSVVIDATTAAQTNQSAIKGFGASNTGNTAGNTGISTGIDWVIAGTNNITISESTAAGGPNTLWISAPNVGAGNVTFSAGAASAGLASVVFSNSNGVSFGLNGSTITASAAGGGGTGSVYAVGNTTQNSSSTQNYSVVSFGGLGAASMGFSSGTIQVSVPNTSSVVGTGGVSVSTNGNTISVSLVPVANFEPIPLLNALSTTWAPTSSSWYFMPVEFPYPMSGGRINQIVAHGSTTAILALSSASFQTGSTGTGSTNFTYQRKAALYSLGAGTNSTRLESMWSSQWSLSIDYSIKVASAAGPNLTVSAGATLSAIVSIDSLGNATTTTIGHSSTLASAASTIATSQLSSINSSERNMLSSLLVIPIPFNTTINPGLYYMANMWQMGSITGGTGNLTSTGNVLSVVNKYAILGNTNTAARLWGQTAATSGSAPFIGVGVYSAASANAPATVVFSDLRTYASMQLDYFNIQNSTI